MNIRLRWSRGIVLMARAGSIALVLGAAVNSSTSLQTRVSRGGGQRIDYSRFSHQTHTIQEKLACDSCHKFPTRNWKDVRKGGAAFPDVAEFPEHSSCLTCHRPQFFARERPAPVICSNCHVNTTPRDTERFLFPSVEDAGGINLKRREFVSEFRIDFPHEKHADVVSFNSPTLPIVPRTEFVATDWQQKKEQTPEPKSCPVCHQTYQPQGQSDEEYATKPPKNLGDAFWLKKGTFKTKPNSHTICFGCHNQDLGIAPSPSDCSGCHKLSPSGQNIQADFDPKFAATIGVTDRTILNVWRRRISAGAFRHEGGHSDISCTNCHNLPPNKTGEAQTLMVPVRSCGGAEGCHITATADDGGILNYEIDQRKTDPTFACTKCHITFGKQMLPANHVEAIPKPTIKVKPSL